MIQWVPFETTRVPDLLHAPLLAADEIWTMTEWSRHQLMQNGFDAARIVIMPQGIDNQFRLSPVDKSHDQTKFLIVAKYEQRKGIREAIDAWAQSRINDGRSLLIIKSHGDQQQFDDLMFFLKANHIENYQVIWGVLPDDDMVNLYQSCHVFLAPTYGEGWGRPIMEAVGSGLPVITTRYSAHGEWLALTKDSVRWIEHDLITVDDRDYDRCYGAQDFGQWARPRVASIRDILNTIDTDLPALLSKAEQSSALLHDQFSWSNIVDRVAKRLAQ